MKEKDRFTDDEWKCEQHRKREEDKVRYTIPDTETGYRYPVTKEQHEANVFL